MPRIVAYLVLASVVVACERPLQNVPNAAASGSQPVTNAVADAERSPAAPSEGVAVTSADDSDETDSGDTSHAVITGNPEPVIPIYVRNTCPGEGCEFGEWLACDTIRVLQEAKVGAPAAFMLRRGDHFTAVTGDVHVTQAGKVVFKREVKVDEEGTNMRFTPADTLYPLLYEGEGFGTWYFHGKQGGGFFFFGGASAEDLDGGSDGRGYRLVRPIIDDWWVRARTKEGKEGWFIPSGSIYGMSPHYEPMPAACPDHVS